jgi:hypothetical protein
MIEFCINTLVHQNVSAADAENKMIEVRQMFVETLDEMAKASADQENIADIQTFSQVIHVYNSNVS